ncbi:MAG TPA: ERF family protein [Clostridia bacterium]
MKPKDTQIITAQETTIVPQDEATALISQAIDKNVPVETMEKLLAMRRELKAEKSQEEFNKSMASFQSECPTIEKTKQGYGYKYAPLESIIEQVKVLLAEHGFSYKFNTNEKENGLIIYCRVNHIGGHSEDSQVFIERENTTKMNASQQSGAVMTYGKRYAFCNAFGILTGDEDTDATSIQKTVNPTPIKPQAEKKVEEPINREISMDQKTQIMILLGKKGKTMDDLSLAISEKFKKTYLKELTFKEADALIIRLQRLPDKEANV